MSNKLTVDDALQQLKDISEAGFGSAPLLVYSEMAKEFDSLAECQGFALNAPNENRSYAFVEVE